MVDLAFADHHGVEETSENKGLQLKKFKLKTSYTVDVNMPNLEVLRVLYQNRR